MASITTMVRQCAGLVGTKDVSHWEETFLDGICERTRDGADTTSLTEKQIEVVERIWRKNFTQ